MRDNTTSTFANLEFLRLCVPFCNIEVIHFFVICIRALHFARQMCVIVNKVAKNVKGWKSEDGTGDFFLI